MLIRPYLTFIKKKSTVYGGIERDRAKHSWADYKTGIDESGGIKPDIVPTHTEYPTDRFNKSKILQKLKDIFNKKS